MLCVVAAFYLVGVVAVVVRQESAVALLARAVARIVPGAPMAIIEFGANVALFVPMGLLFVVIAGKRRWFAVFLLGAIVAMWVQLAEVVWLTRPSSTVPILFAHILGVALGTAIALIGLSAGKRRLQSAPQQEATSPRAG